MSEEQKIALITGANRGLGLEIARQLGKQHITILLGTRNRERGEAAASQLRALGMDVIPLELDVTNQASIEAAARLIEQTYGKLDILVNNAGTAVQGEETIPPSQLTGEDLRATMETNFFGAFAVSRAMLPLLRRSIAGRIVNMASEMGSLSIQSDPSTPLPPMLAYEASKAALNMLTILLAKELQQTPIKVNSVSPGYVSTDFTGHQGWLSVEQGAAVPVTYATLPADGPTGGFFGANGPIPW